VGTFDPATVTFDDFAADVTAAVQSLAIEARYSSIVLIGHSEGGGLALRAANQGAPVVGVISLAAMGRPFLQVLRGQLAEQLDDATMAEFDAAMPRFLEGKDPGEIAASLGPFFLPVNRAYTRSISSFDPPAEVAQLDLPILIVQGATDFQIGVEDAEILANARPDAQLVVIPEANHVFKHARERSRGSQTIAYIDPTQPIVPELVDVIAEWIHALPL
jgi:pimeloyl-ACP methyl ester carboxylesterase